MLLSLILNNYEQGIGNIKGEQELKSRDFDLLSNLIDVQFWQEITKDET